MLFSNFEFLEKDYPKLAELAKEAEYYSFIDSQIVFTKLRTLVELIVDELYQILNLTTHNLVNDSLYERLSNSPFIDAIDQEILSKFHLVRISANKAIHGNKIFSEKDTLVHIQEAYLISKWFIQVVTGQFAEINEFQVPSNPRNPYNEFQENKEKIIKQQVLLEQAKNELTSIQKQIIESKKIIISSTQTERTSSLENFKEKSGHILSGYSFEKGTSNKYIELKDLFVEEILSDSQKRAITKLNHFLTSSSDNVFILKGFAGTGKTFLIAKLDEYLSIINRQDIIMAPTGKAARVISEKTKRDASTIHSAIYNFTVLYEEKSEEERGLEDIVYCSSIKENTTARNTVYIVDEASMVSDNCTGDETVRFGSGYLLTDMLEYIDLENNPERKIIFVGDTAQLPPINMRNSPALSEQYFLEKYRLEVEICELTDVLRQKEGSGILSHATKIRQQITKKVFNHLDFVSQENDICVCSQKDILSNFFSLGKGKISKDVIVIASTNSEVNNINKMIRNYLYPSNKSIQPNDKIVFVANHFLHNRQTFICNGDFGQILSMNDENESRSISLRQKVENNIEVKNITLHFRDVEVAYRETSGELATIRVKILENLLDSDKGNLTKDEVRAIYVDFLVRHQGVSKEARKELILKDPYVNALKVKYGYAITCHKAQGSEWSTPIVCANTYHKNKRTKDYFTWLYTSITRASSKLYIVDPPFFTSSSELTFLENLNLEQVRQEEVNSCALLQSKNSENLYLLSRESKGNLDSEVDYNSFGISPKQRELYGLLNNVKNKLVGTNIFIINIVHHNYQEIYTFQESGKIAKVLFHYNSKNVISSIQITGHEDLQLELHNLLGKITKSKMAQSEVANNNVQYSFSKAFLEDFHLSVLEQIRLNHIDLLELRQLNWMQRYVLGKDSETATLDIYYNSKDIFTKGVPKLELSTSTELLQEVINIFEQISKAKC